MGAVVRRVKVDSIPGCHNFVSLSSVHINAREAGANTNFLNCARLDFTTGSITYQQVGKEMVVRIPPSQKRVGKEVVSLTPTHGAVW